MDDIISRKAAVDTIRTLYISTPKINNDFAYDMALDKADDAIRKLPSAIPHPVHGYMWICPECGLTVHSDFGKCPRCGWERQPEQTRVFVELVVEYPDPELCTYKEYKGKPYYSIKYIENGETYVGYGTYKPEVLSQYLKEYFISSAQPDTDKVARDIATILENEQDMRVILKNAKDDLSADDLQTNDLQRKK